MRFDSRKSRSVRGRRAHRSLHFGRNAGQRGVALAIALILLGVMMVFVSISSTLVTTEARQTNAQYRNAQTYNAATAYLESMTSEFNTLFLTNQNPSPAQVRAITVKQPQITGPNNQPLYNFAFEAPYVPPTVAAQGSQELKPIQTPPFTGLNAIERQYVISATATAIGDNSQVRLIRQLANYQIPIFQFGVFAFDNLEISPGPPLFFGGRTHVNRHLFLRNGGQAPGVNYYGPITTAGQIVRSLGINGIPGAFGSHQVLNNTALAQVVGSVPNEQGVDVAGTATPIDWNLADDPILPNGAGTQASGPRPGVTTSAPVLLLPTQTRGFSSIEILRRARPSDPPPVDANGVPSPLPTSRIFNGRLPVQVSTVRILLDDDIADFPPSIAGEPQAYDLDQLANPNDPFWVPTDVNVRTFNPTAGSDNPDSSAATLPAGSGPGVNNARVLPPQTNVINKQPEFQPGTNTRKRTYVKIELITSNPGNEPTRIDITRHILNLGITAGPIPTITATGAAETSYAAAYALNDGNSIRRLNNPSVNGNQPENFMPFLSDSNTDAFIGQHIARSGTPPPDVTINGTNVTVAYRYEPNSILRLQRTMIPFAPQTNVDMTNADPPAQGDNNALTTPAINRASGRLEDDGDPTDAAGNYPARFKSLIAKPYFRFTDDFRNETYVKGSFARTNAALSGLPNGAGGDIFLLPNPVKQGVDTRLLFNGEAAAGDTDLRRERFMRRITCRAAALDNQGRPITGGNALYAMAPLQPGTLTYSPTTNGSQVPVQNVGYDTIFGTANPNFWTNNPNASDAVQAIDRQLAAILRLRVFKPGVPGFYALALNPADTAGTGAIGDGAIDTDLLGLNNGGINGQQWNANLENAPANRQDPVSGIVDLQEMTPAANINDQALLRKFLFAPATLTDADLNQLFPHILPGRRAQLRTILKAAEIGTPGRPTDPGLSAGTGNPAVPGVPELPKENLLFDWNGDGVIEPPHLPFQTESAVPERSWDANATGVSSLGYSVESNVCSLVPSSLRVLHDPTQNNAVNTSQDPTTSVPVEVIFVEQDTNATGLLAPLPDGPNGTDDPNIINVAGQPEPTITPTLPNPVIIPVPYNTFRGTTNITSGSNNGRRANLREAVSVIFQHPLAARIYLGAPGIAPTTLSNITTGNGSRNNLNLETQIGRRLGLTDVHYAFPGHSYMQLAGGGTLMTQMRVEMDRAFPINVYDQREGRHINRMYGFQGIASAADYIETTLGDTATHALQNNQWPDWPQGAQVASDQRILTNLAAQLPTPSPVAYERRGMMNIVELDIGNLKRLFRGDFNTYLAGIGGGFTSGQPTPEFGGNGIINISDNGFIVYFSDRRGDDNNDGVYEFNDVFGENGVLNLLDDFYENDPTTPANTLIPNSPGPRPGDNILRRDVEVETQPTFTPDAVTPARSGEAPHGAMPVNDGFEFFSGNILGTGTRTDGNGAIVANNVQMLRAGTLLSSLSTAANGGNGAVNWRMVDSAKTGRIRAFRHALRLINAMDIPRWYVNRPNGQDRSFTGLSVVTENPMYLYGNVNSIGVAENNSGGAARLSRIPAGGPTRSEMFLQTGNRNNGSPGVPANFGAEDPNAPNALNPNDRLLHGPMAVMADAVSLHSAGWSDGRMFMNGRSISYRPQGVLQRISVRTSVKCAWLTGQPMAGSGQNNETTNLQNGDGNGIDVGMGNNIANDFNTQGGLHNFPRFSEDWGGNTPHARNFNYNGSFIFQFFSHNANGQWLIGGPNGSLYQPPNPRNWNFDVGFTRANGIPPGTPRLGFFKNGTYRQVFVEDAR
jgi:hypothetical protein